MTYDNQFHRLQVAAAALISTMLASCFTAVDPIEEGSEGNATLHVTTRAVEGEIAYPVMVMAYDDGGTLRGSQTLNSDNDDIRLQLNEGLYHITALCGQSQYGEPESYDSRTVRVTMPDDGYATQPLMMGGADVLLGSGNAMVSIVLSYKVAGINLTLADVPADVTAVSVGVSQQYNAIDMGGALSGTSTVSVGCTKQGELWSSGQFYVLPGTGTSTTLTLSLTDAQGQRSYGYELSQPLQAAIPYTIRGTYVESTAPTITGVLTSDGWRETQTIDFDFGSGIIHSGSDIPQVPVQTVMVDEIPTACSIWDGHIVALTDNVTESEADLLLLSVDERENVYSPKAPNHETDMRSLASAYTEGGMHGWSEPTEQQARALRAAYAGQFDDLNEQIEQLKGVRIDVYSSTNSNARYLCANGEKTFNWAESGSLTTAGRSVKYRLRLVKVIHVVKRSL